jgi:hypothetical protein
MPFPFTCLLHLPFFRIRVLILLLLYERHNSAFGVRRGNLSSRLQFYARSRGHFSGAA